MDVKSYFDRTHSFTLISFYINIQTAWQWFYLSTLLWKFLGKCCCSFAIFDAFVFLLPIHLPLKLVYSHVVFNDSLCFLLLLFDLKIFQINQNSTYKLWQQLMLNPIRCQRLHHFLWRPMPSSFVTFGFRIAWMYLVDSEVMIMMSIFSVNCSLDSPLLLHFRLEHINYQYFHSFYTLLRNRGYHCCRFWNIHFSNPHSNGINEMVSNGMGAVTNIKIKPIKTIKTIHKHRHNALFMSRCLRSKDTSTFASRYTKNMLCMEIDH